MGAAASYAFDIPSGKHMIERVDTYNDYVPKEFSNAVIVDGDLIKNEEFEVARSEIFRKANKAKLYPTK